MSIQIAFKDDQLKLKRLKLPTRFFHFNQNENYIKLLSIGEGIFPKDKIQTSLSLTNSSCVLTSESATKVYPSRKDFAINRLNFKLQHAANLEYINDELILFKHAKFVQLLTLTSDSESTFFYVDVMSCGRSFEYFDFDHFIVRNRFVIDGKLEYFENFSIKGNDLKQYFARHRSDQHYYAKIYIKSLDNEVLHANFRQLGFNAVSQTRSKKMLIGVLNGSNIGELKDQIIEIWHSYRAQLNKNAFDLGKA